MKQRVDLDVSKVDILAPNQSEHSGKWQDRFVDLADHPLESFGYEEEHALVEISAVGGEAIGLSGEAGWGRNGIARQYDHCEIASLVRLSGIVLAGESELGARSADRTSR